MFARTVPLRNQPASWAKSWLGWFPHTWTITRLPFPHDPHASKSSRFFTMTRLDWLCSRAPLRRCRHPRGSPSPGIQVNVLLGGWGACFDQSALYMARRLHRFLTIKPRLSTSPFFPLVPPAHLDIKRSAKFRPCPSASILIHQSIRS